MAGETTQGHKNQKIGHVVSTAMRKTIVVEVTRRVSHPIYKRIITRRKNFYAHDEESTARVGDMVRIIECRPLSRLKRWRLGEVLRRAVQVGVEVTDLEPQKSPAESPGKKRRK